MADPKQYNTNLEANEVASGILDYILQEESPERIVEKANLIKVEEALKAQKILDHKESRELARVLFVTEDLGVLIDDSLEQQYYKNLSLLFAELHVMVVMTGKKENESFRLSENIWVYKVYGQYQFSKLRSARQLSDQHLVFNDVVRPDVIVADNPFVNALVAADLADRLDRPWQLQVSVNVFSKDWLTSKKENPKKQRVAKKIFKTQNLSIRTKTAGIKNTLLQFFPKLSNIDVLPQHYNIEAYKSAVAKFDVHDIYKDYAFIMLVHGPLVADSPLHDVFAAVRPLLLNPRIGIIVLGDGRARDLFKEKVKLLSIEKSVVFVHDTTDAMSYYKTADVFIQPEVSEESEQSVLQAAGAGIAMVLYPTLLREDLFIDGVSAFFCKDKAINEITKHVKYLISSNTMRHQLGMNAHDMAVERIEEDPIAYYRALRYHIESVLLTEET